MQYTDDLEILEEIPETKRGDKFFVAIYSVYRNYGGPEEGGWWYTAGYLDRVIAMERNEEEAYRKSQRANHLLRFFFKKSGRRDMYSMAYSGGQFEAQVHKNSVPEGFPPVRPHYE